MNECMNGIIVLLNEYLNEWMNDWLSAWINAWMDQLLYDWMNT